MQRRQINELTIRSPKLTQPLHAAFVSDLHNGAYDDVLDALHRVDVILIGGDLVKRYDDRYDRALSFLKAAPRLAPTFYAVGNHERKLPSYEAYWQLVKQTDAVTLENRWVRFGGVVLGGMSSAPDGLQDNAVVRNMAEQDGFRLLLCHHPEYYEPYVKPYDIDLTLAGHAHGGQVRLFGQGLFSPGQGLLPKWTSGFYDNGRLFVSRGMTNASRVPRIGNPCELNLIHLLPE